MSLNGAGAKFQMDFFGDYFFNHIGLHVWIYVWTFPAMKHLEFSHGCMEPSSWTFGGVGQLIYIFLYPLSNGTLFQRYKGTQNSFWPATDLL